MEAIKLTFNGVDIKNIFRDETDRFDVNPLEYYFGVKAPSESYVSTFEPACNTGGHIYNDIITLKNGYIIRVSEDGIGIYSNAENDQDGVTVARIEI